MKGFIRDLWWILLLHGIVLLLFGLAMILWPGLTFVSLSLLFSAYVLVSGVINILVAIGAITARRSWFLRLLLGIVEIGVGVYLLKIPGLALSIFVLAVGAIFLLQGIFTIIASIADTRDAGMRILEIVSGILGIIAGFIVLENPVTGGIAFVWVLGVYGLIAGTINISAALSLRHIANEVEKIARRK